MDVSGFSRRASSTNGAFVVSYSVYGAESVFSLVPLAIIAIVLVASWVILAGSRFVQGGIVERPERVPQLYGYTACLIALVVALVSLISIIENALALGNPTHSSEGPWGDWSQPSVTSFEAFRVTYDRTRTMHAGPNAPPPEPVPEPELRRRYEALRADRIETNRLQAWRRLVGNGLTLLVAIALFAWHWRWLRTRPAEERAAPGAQG
jgi:hypothetical protein